MVLSYCHMIGLYWCFFSTAQMLDLVPTDGPIHIRQQSADFYGTGRLFNVYGGLLTLRSQMFG